MNTEQNRQAMLADAEAQRLLPRRGREIFRLEPAVQEEEEDAEKTTDAGAFGAEYVPHRADAE